MAFFFLFSLLHVYINPRKGFHNLKTDCMKMNIIFTFYFILFGLSFCLGQTTGSTTPTNAVEQQLRKLSELRTEVEKNDDLRSFLKYYDTNAISMPECQPMLIGMNEIESYYKEIFQRQKVKSFRRTTNEIIDLGKTKIEFGTFKKEYTSAEADTVLAQRGKYCNIWEMKPDGGFKLKGEVFNFFHPVANPEDLAVQIKKTQPESSTFLAQEIPFELKAYNALNEKLVRIRDGAARSEFYDDDARIMPGSDTIRTGIGVIRPHLIAYSSGGDVTLDSVSVSTYHYEYFDEYILEYAKFRVKWRVPQSSGRTEGQVIRIWKRQKDKSLKMYREIGTHNHIE
jgi:ketosteroid isomerase-like protein